MKVVLFLAGLALFLTVTGCEEEHEHHHHEGYGGSYEGGYYPDYGHGEYRPYYHEHD